MRAILAKPVWRKQIAALMCREFRTWIYQAEAIACVALGGVALATEISSLTGDPLLVVRPERKEHGQQDTVFPAMNNRHVVLIEDVVTTGQSSIAAIKQLNQVGHGVLACFAVVDRGQGGLRLIEEEIYMQNISLPTINIGALFSLQDIVEAVQ